jgi:membrane-anchored glycerophosphoryl diester phosphodiesterase (GDPDase)
MTYMISLLVLLLVAIYLKRSYSSVLTYGGIHALAVSAGIMFELTILTRKFWREGFAVGNLYSRLTTYILILIPGFVIVMLPIIATAVASFFAQNLALPLFLVMASSEFAVMTTVVALQK